jgi:bifunctional DNA-binding transcriptional regulator/antitoxin component of YhaV-PrlF toxin-antitoxin module
MGIHSKLTAQAQVSVPAGVRKALGVGPGSVIAWETDGDRIVVRRVGRYSSTDIHDAVFGASRPRRKSDRELKAGIATYMRDRNARR